MRQRARISERRAGKPSLDWASAYRRLEKTLAHLETGNTPDPERAQRILQERAAAYAIPQTKINDLSYLEAIVFEIDRERFAVKLSGSFAAIALAGMMTIPSLPSFYLGLTNYRGGIFPIIDIRLLIGLVRQKSKVIRHAVLIKSTKGVLGLAASEIIGTERFGLSQVATVSDESPMRRALIGIGSNETIILDGDLLMQDMRLLVDEQPRIAVRRQGETS